jgi:hypothetical protein
MNLMALAKGSALYCLISKTTVLGRLEESYSVLRERHKRDLPRGKRITKRPGRRRE